MANKYTSTRWAVCHPDRKHKAHGLCYNCFQKSGFRDKNPRKAVCHPDRPHQAKGFCKPCYMQRYQKIHQNKEHVIIKRREASWRANGFKMTVPEYNKMLKKQGGVCAICRKTTPGDRRGHFSVDHDHATGKIRGLLCDYCNRRLLVPRNTPEILERAAAYLRGRHRNPLALWDAIEITANTPAAPTP